MASDETKKKRIEAARVALRRGKLPPGLLANAIGAAASSMSTQFFPEMSNPLEAATRPFVGALTHRAIDWVGEKAGRRIVVERSPEGFVEIWAEEDGEPRRRFGFEMVKGGL